MDPSQTPSWLKSLLSLQPDELRKAIESLRPDQIAEIERVLRWSSQPGPQTAAFRSKADILFYGGAAGGGVARLSCGGDWGPSPCAHPHSRALSRTRRGAGIVDGVAVWLPISAIATLPPRRVDPSGRLYARVCTATGQPDLFD